VAPRRRGSWEALKLSELREALAAARRAIDYALNVKPLSPSSDLAAFIVRELQLASWKAEPLGIEAGRELDEAARVLARSMEGERIPRKAWQAALEAVNRAIEEVEGRG